LTTVIDFENAFTALQPGGFPSPPKSPNPSQLLRLRKWQNLGHRHFGDPLEVATQALIAICPPVLHLWETDIGFSKLHGALPK